MRIVGLTPTYRRQRTLANALACFLDQTHEDKYLVICDDSGELSNQKEESWEVLATPPFASLPEKYDFMARRAFDSLGADAVAVMEDDDVYFPDYIRNHVLALMSGGWSHCSWCYTDGSGGGPVGPLQPERTGNSRLHGCLAMSKEAWQQVGGWGMTRRMDFDLQVLSRLRIWRPAADPCDYGLSQYFFRWATTHEVHGQCHSTGPDDENWMARAQAEVLKRMGPVVPSGPLSPIMDAETFRTLRQFREQSHIEAPLCV